MSEYVRGPSYARKHARLETRMGTPSQSGRGYERIRTTEHVDSDPRDGAVDVEFSHHRLLALAWDVGECLPDADYEGLVDPAILDGWDVHHDAPEADAERGVEWDNRECVLALETHADHAGLTNAERRAYAADGQRLRDGETTLPEAGCPECGDTDVETPATVGDTSGLCIECATTIAERTDETVRFED